MRSFILQWLQLCAPSAPKNSKCSLFLPPPPSQSEKWIDAPAQLYSSNEKCLLSFSTASVSLSTNPLIQKKRKFLLYKVSMIHSRIKILFSFHWDIVTWIVRLHDPFLFEKRSAKCAPLFGYISFFVSLLHPCGVHRILGLEWDSCNLHPMV